MSTFILPNNSPRVKKTTPTQDVDRARRYLRSVESLAHEAAVSNDPRVIETALAVLDLQSANHQAEWTPRQELRRRLPALLRRLGGDLRLLLRVLVAIALGSQARCNAALDALIEREEQWRQHFEYPPIGREPFNADPEDIDAAWTQREDAQ
ncbi:MAG: hypothetical protein LAP38_03235 [Acidobacteriia bacterium]|nr:hypothetical protein [Terriglobia bacterium]